MTNLATCTDLTCRSPRARRSLLGRVMHQMAVHRQRRALVEMESHRLEDIGLTREQAEAEASRPIWDVPAHWRD